jgi:hypothetical protein
MKVLRVCNTRSKKPKLAGKIIMKWEKTDYSHSILIFDDIVYESSYFGCEIQLLSKFLKTDIIVTEAYSFQNSELTAIYNQRFQSSICYLVASEI